jgi:hypothetical protein
MDIDPVQYPPKPENLGSTPILPPPAGGTAQEGSQELTSGQRRGIIFAIIFIIVVLAAIVASIIFLMQRPLGEVARIRDIFIIFMAIQSLLTGLALVVLMVQLARLINLLQNEVKPILDSTNETVSNLRGTTVFLSDNLVGPVIKLNEYLAGLTQLMHVIGLFKRSDKRSEKRSDNRSDKPSSN